MMSSVVILRCFPATCTTAKSRPALPPFSWVSIASVMPMIYQAHGFTLHKMPESITVQNA